MWCIQANVMNQLEQLKKYSTVVIDTGDMDAIGNFHPEDATTNPSLIFKAAQLPRYQELLQQVLFDYRHRQLDVPQVIDRISVGLGAEILQLIPGRISTEVDARLSFDQVATVQRARQLIASYEQLKVERERVLIKIATTWEGIRACAVLEAEGIHTNMTLIFSLIQAEAAAQSGAFLISPFVGRILDWYQKNEPERQCAGALDPGVQSVKAIYKRFKEQGYATQVMAASFRNLDEIRLLAGCDRLTIAPALMQALQQTEAALECQLQLRDYKRSTQAMVHIDEKRFRWALNEEVMAHDKLAEGIRLFTHDLRQLEALIQQRWQQQQ